MIKQAFKIPEEFELHGITYRVSFLDKLAATETRNGQTDFNTSRIELQSIEKGAAMCPDRQGQVFCHELIHAILFEAKQDELNKDEDLVDLLGSLLHQALTTAVYGKEKAK